MDIPFSVKRMIDTELHFPQRFTQMVNKNYGMIFWNEGNKASDDSNHAVITDPLGAEASVRDIEFFFKSKGINPRIYPAFNPNELEKLTPALENHGFCISIKPDRFFLLQRESTLRPSGELRIQRITHLDIDIMEAIAVEYGGDWTIKVVERHLLHPSYHLLGGFIGDTLASLASVSVYAGYSRVDDVFTRNNFRGRGFAGGTLNYLLKYHRQISSNHVYIYSSHPESIKVYQKAGFDEIAPELAGWIAIKSL
jgi:GNAT superfamily N-acetyltransferase